MGERSPTRVPPSEENLLSACQRNSLEEVKRLLSLGANPTLLDRNGSSLLFYCCSEEQVPIVRLLLEGGVDVNSVNVRGNTILHIAAKKQLNELALVLLMHGADPTAHDKTNRTPEDIAPLRPLIEFLAESQEGLKLLTESHRVKLTALFCEIAHNEDHISTAKCAKFNEFMEDVSEDAAHKDALEFLANFSLCYPGRVIIDEWILAFAKLASEGGAEALDNFLAEYEANVKLKGKFSK